MATTGTEYSDRVMDAFAAAPEHKRTELWAQHENAYRAAALMRAGVVALDGLTLEGDAALMRLGDALGVDAPKVEMPTDPKPKR